MSEAAVLEMPRRNPTVYFIDDSATMREVMKIAFRRENISVVACHDAASALAEIEQAPPDVVITDIVMPDKDGFEVCDFIKRHPALSKTPVVLLSGEINREVAEKAAGVKADDLIRKPFQPQELIARVRGMLGSQLANTTAAQVVPVATAAPANAAAPPSSAAPAAVAVPAGASAPPAAPARPAPNRGQALSAIFGNGSGAGRPPLAPRSPSAIPAGSAAGLPSVPPAPRAASPDAARLRLEIFRLETLVKKLQSELAAERDYVCALEAHVKTLQESE
jgi:CheY-like chemotaxis protein